MAMWSLFIVVLLQTNGNVPDAVAKATAYAEKYRERLPSLECDEAIVSTILHKGKIKKEVQIEGTFRVVRSGAPAEPFVETHQFKAVNGKPVPKHFNIPYFVQGAFSNGVGFTPETAYCFDYAAGPAPDMPHTSLIVRRTRPGAEKTHGCEKIRFGEVRTTWFDDAEKVIVRVEVQLPEGVAQKDKAPYFGGVDYGRVQIGNDVFWLPVRVASHDEKNEGRFEARYSNFHRYGATVRIVPDSNGESTPK